MQSYLANSIMNKPLENQSLIRPTSRSANKALVASLILTSLVDAFSILVIYLIMNSSAAQEMKLENEIQLPMATKSDVLDAGVVVSVSKAGYRIGEELVAEAKIFETLKLTQETVAADDEERSQRLIIQADKSAAFEKINPLVMAGTQTGFTTIKFAVLPDEGGTL